MIEFSKQETMWVNTGLVWETEKIQTINLSLDIQNNEEFKSKRAKEFSHQMSI